MKGGSPNLPQADPALANVDSSDLATNQESKPIPFVCGERKIALRWISPIYDQFTKNAPAEVPGKK